VGCGAEVGDEPAGEFVQFILADGGHGVGSLLVAATGAVSLLVAVTGAVSGPVLGSGSAGPSAPTRLRCGLGGVPCVPGLAGQAHVPGLGHEIGAVLAGDGGGDVGVVR
jgi:hypothetical protein